MVELKEVKTNRELKKFVKFPIELYKDNKYYAPDLIMDEMTNLRKDKNPAFEYCDARYFLSYREGKIVGRIAAIVSHKANEKWNTKRMRFCRIDFIDDDEVVDALFDAVEGWAKELGLIEVHGPLGFTDLDKEGMLVKGFDENDLFITYYNHPYYITQLERKGYIKDVDWIEYQVTVPKVPSDRVDRLSEIVLKRQKLHELILYKKSVVKPYIHGMFELVNEAYDGLYGTVELTQKQIDWYVKMYYPVMVKDYIKMVLDENGKLAAFGLAAPSLAAATKKCRGRLFPFGFIYVLNALRKNNVLELFLVAVRKDLQNTGVNAVMINSLTNSAIKNGIEYAETGPELEMNDKVLSFWKNFDARQHRTRRCFIKKLQ